MKRSLKSLLALMLAYFMLIAGTCDGVFSVAVLAAEREDAFAYADSLTHDAAANGAVGTAVTGDEDVFGVSSAAPEDAGVGQILSGNATAEETEEAALYETGDALTTLLKVELREDVSLKTSYEPGGIVLLELDLASATFYKVDDSKKEPVSVTQKGESILYKEVAGVHVGNNNKCVLDPEDIEFNEEGYVLAETELPF
nr:hypothetical protein [Lachnospiraceae bacterium]